jgi:hypothetical protein
MSSFIDGNDQTVESGQLTAANPDFQTGEDSLNESVGQSIMRDLRSIGAKLLLVLIPRRRNELQKELKNCYLFVYFENIFFFKGIYGDR